MKRLKEDSIKGLSNLINLFHNRNLIKVKTIYIIKYQSKQNMEVFSGVWYNESR